MNVLEQRQRHHHWRGGASQTERAAALHALREAEANFLAAWKGAVRLVGAQYFDVINTYFYEFASKKDQLRPNYKTIKAALGSIPLQQGLFLCALYTYYNADEGRRLTEQYYPSCCSRDLLLRQLEANQREILQTLSSNYTDW
jgi:hypothetical protein